MPTLAALAVLFAPAAALAQQKVSERHAVAPDAAIRIYGSFASVRIVGWDRDSVVVLGGVGAGERLFSGGGRSGRKYGLELADGGSGFSETPTARVEFRVPARARVWVKTGSADVEVSGVTGGLDVNIVSGAIRVTGSPRELTAEAMDGTIEVRGAVPWLRAKTAGGAITAIVEGEDIALSSVSGAVSLAGGGLFRRVRLETVTGDVRFDGALDRGGRLDADSHGGTIDVALPPRQAADFVLTNITGPIKADFEHGQPRGAAEMRGRELVFSTHGGGASVAVRNFKGAVVVRKQGTAPGKD